MESSAKTSTNRLSSTVCESTKDRVPTEEIVICEPPIEVDSTSKEFVDGITRSRNQSVSNPSSPFRDKLFAFKDEVRISVPKHVQQHTPVLTQAQKREIEEVFQLFDTDGSGTMEVNELKVVFWAMGFQPGPGDTEAMVSEFFEIPMEEIDDYSMSQPDFLNLMIEKLSTRDMFQSLKTTFQLFDQENKGYVERKDIKRVCKEINEVVSDIDLELMMAHIDKSGDGSVTVDEWITVMSDNF